jgi:hypothetical protein
MAAGGVTAPHKRPDLKKFGPSRNFLSQSEIFRPSLNIYLANLDNLDDESQKIEVYLLGDCIEGGVSSPDVMV